MTLPRFDCPMTAIPRILIVMASSCCRPDHPSIRASRFFRAVVVVLCLGIATHAAVGGTILGAKETQFTLNGQPTFLLGISYYAALGTSDENLRRDLDEMQRHGFNWLRLWVTWAAFDHDVSAVDAEGRAREPYLGRLQQLVAECDRRGMVVDVSLSRGNGVTGPPRLQTQPSHRRAVATVVNALKPFRNWYVDLSNERNVNDKRFTSVAELKELRQLAATLNSNLLVTASHAGDISSEELRDYVNDIRVDFIAPHRPRGATSAGETEARTRRYLDEMKRLGRPLPVHYQEPFRRAFGKWQPTVEDFMVDLRGAIAGQAAGWCFHNGDQRGGKSDDLRRSFDLRDQTLFGHLDAEEDKVLEHIRARRRAATAAPPPGPLRISRENPRYFAAPDGKQPASTQPDTTTATTYFPPPESQGGWRSVENENEIETIGEMDKAKVAELREWLLKSDNRPFAAVVIRHGTIVLQVERGNSAVKDARRVASVSKAVCATVLAIASEQSQQGTTPRKMSFDDKAFDFIPWAQPLSDPRKAQITVKQLLNHTSGICPEATGAPNDGKWDYILGHSGDKRTERLAFDPGKGCGYSTHALAHAALVCETVTGKPYDQFAIEAFFKPLGIEHWTFQFYDGPENYGRHPSHNLGMPARDLARIGYCLLRNGRWGERQVIPKWFVEQSAAPTHDVTSPEMRWKLNPQVFSHGWELPSRHDPKSGRSGAGIPADARSKPGSGGQLIAFVPSLDLVITRQTGSSGEWQFEEFLRRACDAVLPVSN